MRFSILTAHFPLCIDKSFAFHPLEGKIFILELPHFSTKHSLPPVLIFLPSLLVEMPPGLKSSSLYHSQVTSLNHREGFLKPLSLFTTHFERARIGSVWFSKEWWVAGASCDWWGTTANGGQRWGDRQRQKGVLSLFLSLTKFYSDIPSLLYSSVKSRGYQRCSYLLLIPTYSARSWKHSRKGTQVLCSDLEQKFPEYRD